MLNRKKLRKAIIKKISNFGDGMEEFHTRHIEELLNWIKELESKQNEQIEFVEHETHESHE